jgi:branched-chain amino acid transport system substrate-binding protein
MPMRRLIGITLVAVVTLVAAADGATSVLGVQPLPSSFCSRVMSSANGRPDLLITSDDALKLGHDPATMVAAVKFVLAQRGFKAGRFSIGYQSCDNSTPQNPHGDLGKCASNAKAYAANQHVVGIIGTWSSDCSEIELPLIERSASGPLALVSPASTSPGLTHASLGSAHDEPQRYYPAGTRNFVRLIPPDDFQGIAAALLAKKLHVHDVFVLDDQLTYGLDVVGGFEKASRNLGLSISGRATWGPSQSHFEPLVNRVRRAHPAAVLLAGFLCPACGAFLQQLHSALPATILIAPDGFSSDAQLLKRAGAGAEGMYLLTPGLAPNGYGATGRELVRRFGITRAGSGGAPGAAQAAVILLDAIARSDGSRASVTAQVLATSVNGGILGTFRFDRNGDMSPSPVSVVRVEHGHQLPDRILRVSSQLLGQK